MMMDADFFFSRLTKQCKLSDTVCKSLLKLGAYCTLTKTMRSYSQVNSIVEYGCWALCNMSVVGKWCRVSLVVQVYVINVDIVRTMLYTTNNKR